MDVLQYISELLYHHDCVIVPGFGGFIANPVSASIHPVTHSFSPPRKEILFNASLTTNDGILANYIAGKENISYEHAIHEIFNFVAEAKATLINDKKIGVAEVGTIYYDDQQRYTFKPNKEINYMLSSFGLTEFISPAIQREGIEKRLEKAFSENKVFRSERKKQNVFAKVAVISIPAAAVFVWGFLNVNTIRDISVNYSDLISVFTAKAPVKAPETNKESSAIRSNSPFVLDNPFYISGKYNIFEERTPPSIIYPCLVRNAADVSIPAAETSTSEESVASCKYYIIGSCNKNIEFAENYKNKLLGKGYSNAHIIEPSGGGLYKVCISCFDSEDTARNALVQIHNEENPEAWLLKM